MQLHERDPWSNPYDATVEDDYILTQTVNRGGGLRRGTVLSGLGDIPNIGSQQDPIANFGREAGKVVLDYAKSLPPEWKKTGLKAILDQLDPTLWFTVSEKAIKLQQEKRYSATEALEKALQISIANGFLKQISTAKRTNTIEPASLLGLGALDEGYKIALSGYLSKLKGAARKVAKAPIYVGNKISKGAKTTYRKGIKALDKIKNLSCKALNSPVAPMVAGAVATAAGGPGAGMSAASTVQSVKQSGVCNKLSKMEANLPPELQQQEKSGLPVPLIVGGAAAALLLL